MGVEYVEKTKTLIGTKRKELIDKETAHWKLNSKLQVHIMILLSG